MMSQKSENYLKKLQWQHTITKQKWFSRDCNGKARKQTIFHHLPTYNPSAFIYLSPIDMHLLTW
jgi:hypothetical protein